MVKRDNQVLSQLMFPCLGPFNEHRSLPRVVQVDESVGSLSGNVLAYKFAYESRTQGLDSGVATPLLRHWSCRKIILRKSLPSLELNLCPGAMGIRLDVSSL